LVVFRFRDVNHNRLVVDYGVARMLATYGEYDVDPPALIEEFRDTDKAWHWLSDVDA